MAKPTTGCTVSHCLYELYCREGSSERQRDKQSRFPCAGHKHRRSERITGDVAGRKRRRKVLAERPDRAEKPRPSGHPDRLCGWPEGLPGCDKLRLPADPYPAVQHPYGA